MKRFFFFLVALMGMVSFASAQTYKSFSIDPKEVSVDQTLVVTTADFKVTSTDANPVQIADPSKAYLYDGTAKVATSTVTIQPGTDPGTFNVKIDNGSTPLEQTSATKKYLIVFEQGAFKDDNGELNNELTARLIVIGTPTFSTGSSVPTYYVEEGIASGDYTTTISASGSNNDENNKIISLGSLPTGVTGVVNADGTATLTYAPAYYTMLGVGSYDEKVSAGTFKTKYSTNDADVYTIKFVVKKRVNFEPTVTTSPIGNLDQTFDFTMSPDPLDPLVKATYWDVLAPASEVNSVTISRKEGSDWKEVGTWCNVTYKEATGVYTLKELDEYTLTPGGEYKMVVNGKFYAENTFAYKSTEATFTVNQETADDLVIEDNLLEGTDIDMYVDGIEVSFPAGVTAEGEMTFTAPAAGLEITCTTDASDTRAVKSIEKTDNGYKVTFDTKLQLGNEYLLKIPAGTFAGMGSDKKLHKNVASILYVTVAHAFVFNDAYDDDEDAATPALTTTETEVNAALDTYDWIHYNRTFTGKMEALYVPFDVDLKEVADYDAFEENFQVFKINNFTQDGLNSTEVHVTATTKLFANMPYLIIAKEAGNQTIEMKNCKVVAPKPFVYGAPRVSSSTVYNVYNVHGTTETKTGMGDKYLAISPSGVIKPVPSTSVTVNPWRWVIRTVPTGIVGDEEDPNWNYVNIVVDDEETAIINVESESSNGAIYNVAGQRIANPVKGQVYLMNGKKYIAK